MLRSSSLTRPKRSPKRLLAVESLSERVVFSTYPLPVEGITPEAIELSVNTGTSGTLQIPAITLQLGTLEPGQYALTFNINLNVTVAGDSLEGPPAVVQPPTAPEAPPIVVEPPALPDTPIVIVEPPIREEPAADVPAPVEPLQSLGQEFYQESFDGGKVADFWTEYAPLAPTQFVEQSTGDLALMVSHTKDEDRVVLRKELGAFESIYVTFEETFGNGFEQSFWSLKQARLYDETGSMNGTFDFALWGIDDCQTLSYVYQETGEGGRVPFPFSPGGEPVRVSFFVAQNTPGKADGRLLMWRDDELVLDVDDAIFRTRPGGPSGISFINNYSGGRLGDPSPPLERVFDDILFLTDPTLAPELIHELALEHLGH